MEGGVGAFTRELARELGAAGHQVHVITSREARPSGGEQRWWRLREPVDIGFAQLHPRVRRWWWPAATVVADVALRYELQIINIQYQAAAYDMRVPAVNFFPWRLRGLARTVVTFHDLRVPYLFPKAGRLRQWVVQRLARSADGVIATNQEDYQALRQWQIEESRLRHIPIGSNIAARTPPAGEVAGVREKLGLAAGDCLLGYFGFLNESKGADTLLQALARLDERMHLVFIGGRTGSSDPENNQAFLAQLEELVGELGLGERVHWSGFLPEQEVSAYLQAADLMVMPYRDGVSLRRGTLMAVLAHGRPLITTAPASPTPELVHGENVWFAPVDNPAALADTIGSIAADPALRAKLGEGAVCVADLFTWDKIAAQTAAFFHELVEGSD